MKTKNIFSALAVVFLVAITLYSALADHNFLDASWSGREENNFSAMLGEDAVVHLDILSSGNNVALQIKLLTTDGELVRTIVDNFPVYSRDLWQGDQSIDTAGLTGAYDVQITALDWNGHVDEETLYLYVEAEEQPQPVNHAPYFTAIPEPDRINFAGIQVYEYTVDEPIIIFLDGRDQDRDDLTFTLESISDQPMLPDGVATRLLRNGAQQNDYLISGRAQETGQFRFFAIVSDGELSFRLPFTLIISEEAVPPVENAAPAMNAVADREVNEDENLAFAVSATDAENDNLLYRAQVQRSFLGWPYFSNSLFDGMTFDRATGQFNFAPDFDFVDHPSTERNVVVRFRAFDGEDPSLWEMATIIVNDVNRDPEITAFDVPETGAEDVTVYFTSRATDADGDDLSYSWNFGDGTSSTDDNPTHTYSEPRNYTVILTVSDDFGGIDVARNWITVESLAEDEVSGCTDPVADNYNPDATINDGSCTYPLEGNDEICTNNLDDDADGFVDCADLDCAEAEVCQQPGEEVCTNGLDDDADQSVDCADSDCTEAEVCQAPEPDLEVCTNNLDDDADGFVDCSDLDCAEAEVCQQPGEEVCTNGLDDDADQSVDCADSDCSEAETCQLPAVEICYDGLDNDADLFVDCADSECASAGVCQLAPVEEIPHSNLKIKSISLSSEELSPGDYLTLSVGLFNNGDVDLDDAAITVMVYDWNVKVAGREFDLDHDDSYHQLLYLPVPYETLPGDYLIKISVSDDHYHESAYRLVTVR